MNEANALRVPDVVDDPSVKQMLLLLSTSVGQLQSAVNDVRDKVVAIDERTQRVLSIVDPQLKTPAG